MSRLSRVICVHLNKAMRVKKLTADFEVTINAWHA